MIPSSTYTSYQSSTSKYNRFIQSNATLSSKNPASSSSKTDSFVFNPYTVANKINTYTPAATAAPAAPAKTTASQAPSVATASDRSNTADYYNQVLTDLRSQYSEAEAMRKFDAILRDDGFELVDCYSGTAALSLARSEQINGLANKPLTLYSCTDADLMARLSGNGYDKSASLILQSNAHSTYVNGQAEVAAETWAIFSPPRPLSTELQDYWQNRYKDKLAGSTILDVDAYMAKLPDSQQRSAVAVNTDIAAMVSGLLKQNGIQLEPGEQFDIGYHEDVGIYVNVEAKHNLSEIFNGSEALVAAVKEQFYNPPPENVSALPGAYEDGDRSVEYHLFRNLTYSADEPSAVVVNDFLGVVGNGYTYAKKAGDYFDATADVFNTRVAVPVMMQAYDPDFTSYHKNATTALNAFVRDSLDSGQPVEATIPMSVIDSVMAEANAKCEEYQAGLTFYEPFDEGGPPPAGYEEEEGALVEENTPHEKRMLSETEQYIADRETFAQQKQAMMKSIAEKFRAIQNLARA